MKKYRKLLTIALFFVVAGLGEARAGSQIVTDKFGRKVEIETPVKRAVLLDTYELAATLGVWNQVVGLSRFAFANDLMLSVEPNLKTRFADVGTPVEVNYEVLLSLKPDLVITWDLSREIVDFIEAKGLKVIALRPESFEDVMAALRLEGKLFGAEVAAAKAEQAARNMMDFVRKRTHEPILQSQRRGLWMVGKQNTVAGKDGVLSSLLETANVENVAAKDIAPRTGIASLEKIIAWNPDLLIVWGYSHIKVDDIRDDPQWRPIAALRNGGLVRGPRWSTSSPRVAPIALWLAATAYPERFADIDVIAKTDEFMRSVFNAPYAGMNPLASP